MTEDQRRDRKSHTHSPCSQAECTANGLTAQNIYLVLTTLSVKYTTENSAAMTPHRKLNFTISIYLQLIWYTPS